MKKKYLTLIFLFLIAAFFNRAVAQKVSVDTLSTSDKYVKVIIYSDKTWDSLVFPKPKHYNSEVYASNWKTDDHNAYRGEVDLASLPDTIDLVLVEDSADFHMPREGMVYSRYGWRHGRAHTGVDIPLHIGDSVYSAFEGKVRYTGYCGGYGNLIVIRHANGLETYYGHLSKILVDVNEPVDVGEVIGLGGSTGRSTGPHLHFETRYMGFPFDPETIVVWNDNKLRNDTLELPRTKLNNTSRYSSSSGGSSSGGAVDTSVGTWHVIVQGDTLGAIARRYGTSVDRICSLNDNLTPNTILCLGRKIRVK